MNLKINNLICLVLLCFISFTVNYYYGSLGVLPIDTFAFFDTGYYTAKGYHPVKDFWVISGILIDYIQGFFFNIFGFNWNAYVFHASFFNIIISLFFIQGWSFINRKNSHLLLHKNKNKQ